MKMGRRRFWGDIGKYRRHDIYKFGPESGRRGSVWAHTQAQRSYGLQEAFWIPPGPLGHHIKIKNAFVYIFLYFPVYIYIYIYVWGLALVSSSRYPAQGAGDKKVPAPWCGIAIHFPVRVCLDTDTQRYVT